jgi:hypothetical protein
MINWIRENAGLASFLGSLIFIISTVAVSYHQLSGLIESQPAIQSHVHDSARHVDLARDAEEHKRLLDRVEKLEERLNWMESRRGWNRGRNQNDFRRTR